MITNAFHDALDALEHAETSLAQARRAVWLALSQAEPDLTRELTALFGNEDAAASWVTRLSRRHRKSPAQKIACGQRDDVIAQALRAAHGIAG